MSVMPVWFILWVHLICAACAIGFRHRHRSPRLIHHRAPSRHSHHHSAKQIDYDRLLEKREIAELFADNADEDYDNYYDQYFEEMDATVAYVVTQANRVATAIASKHELFRASPKVDPPYIQVHYPTNLDPLAWGHWHRFEWEKYTDEVDKGIMSEAQIKSVHDEGSLRKHTQLELLKYSIVEEKINGWDNPVALDAIVIPAGDPRFDNDRDRYFHVHGVSALDMCLNDLGSKTAKSDLDFTYIFWPEPLKVVDTMVLFYNKFYEFYGDWPLDVYDMNLYIACGLVQFTCVEQWPDTDEVNRIKALFTAIEDPIGADNKPLWELGKKEGYKNDNNDDKGSFYKVDMYMAYLWVKRRLDLKTLDERKGDPKLKILTEYSAVFYWYLNEIKLNRVQTDTNTKKSNAMLFLKALLYGMNYWSDESYITNSALQLIFKKAVGAIPEQAKFLAVLDCTAFIYRYDREATRDKESDLWFFDKTSKYMMRNGKLLQYTKPFASRTKKETITNFPDIPYNFFKKDTPKTADFDEDKIGLSGYALNYFALAEQWSGAWEGDGKGGAKDGRVKVKDGLNKIRGDVPLIWVEKGHVKGYKIWSKDYNDKYEAWRKYKAETSARGKQKILDDVGIDNEAAMLVFLAYDDGKRHTKFKESQYADLGRLFFRARKIWDLMKGVNRWKERALVMSLLTGMVAKVERYEVQANFKEGDKVKEVERIVKAIQDNVYTWATATVKTKSRKRVGAGTLSDKTPKKKEISFTKDEAKMTRLIGKGIFNYFNEANTQKTLGTA